MKKVLFLIILINAITIVQSQNVDLNNGTDYIRVQKSGETSFSRAFGLNGSNELYIGSVEKTIGNIYFFNKGTNHLMTIKPNGYVGIGTTTPTSNFSAGSLINLKSFSNAEIVLDHDDGGSSSNIGILSFERNKDHLAHIKASHDGSTDSAFLSFHTQALGGGFVNLSSNEKMRITSDGNVGIGTSNPNAKLDITENSSTDAIALRLTNSGWASNMSTSLEFKTGSFKSVATSKISSIMNGSGNAGDRLGFFVQENGTNPNNNPLVERLSLLPNGNLGIGIISPNSMLHVKADTALGQTINDQSVLTTVEGSVVGNNSKFQILNKRNDNGANWNNTSLRLQRMVDATPQAFIDFGIEGENLNYGLAFGTRNGFSGTQQTRMVIEENGNVGIGTTDTQGFKLGVNGKIAATEVKIATYANWADFVFNEEYDLPSLNEVELYIKNNGHLEDIPSAETVEKDGFYLAEMNAKLLQKIEELTLYTIEQEKEIENQKAINKSLEERLQKIEAVLIRN